MSEVSKNLFLEAVYDKVANKAAATRILRELGHFNRKFEHEAPKLYRDLANMTSHGATPKGVLKRVNNSLRRAGYSDWHRPLDNIEAIVSDSTVKSTPIERMASNVGLSDYLQTFPWKKKWYALDLRPDSRKIFGFPTDIGRMEKRAADTIAQNKRIQALEEAHARDLDAIFEKYTAKPVEHARSLLYAPVLGY